MIKFIKLVTIAVTVATLVIVLTHKAASAPSFLPYAEANNDIVLHPGQYEAPTWQISSLGTSLESDKIFYGKEVPIKEYAEHSIELKWGKGEWKAFDDLVNKESHYDHNAINPISGACGIPQALPCSKLGTKDPQKQIDWMIDYIADRYGTPTEALKFHERMNWY